MSSLLLTQFAPSPTMLCDRIRSFGKRRGVISLGADDLRERASQVIPCSQTIEDLAEVDTTPYASPVDDGTDVSCERRFENVEADDLMFQIAQSADQGLAKVTRAACDQHSRARLIQPARRERRLGHEQLPQPWTGPRVRKNGVLSFSSICAQPFDRQVRRESVSQSLVRRDQICLRA